MASPTPATRYSGYLQIKQAGILLGLFPVPVGTPCDKRAWKDTPENRANLRPSLPTYDNVQYVPSGCADLALVVAEATKCTALAFIRVKDGSNDYVSLLAQGSGVLGYELIGINVASPNPSKKVFDSAGGPYPVPSSIGSGTAGFGGFYGSPAQGDYRLKVYDDAGGVSSYTVPIGSTSTATILKGSFGTTGGGTGPVTPTDPPDYALTGNAFVSLSSRSDLASFNVITGQDANGDWRYIIRDVSTGNYPNKGYFGTGFGSFIDKTKLHSLNPYLAFPLSVTVTEDQNPTDAKAHCNIKIIGY